MGHKAEKQSCTNQCFNQLTFFHYATITGQGVIYGSFMI